MDDMARAADALAAAYPEVIELPADTLGLIFAVFDQGDYPYDFVQPPVAIPRAKLAWCAEHGRLGDLWMPYDPPDFAGAELAYPQVGPELEAACRPLIESEDEPLGPLYDALVARLHAALDVLVLHDHERGREMRDQLADQLSPEELARWRENDWLERSRVADAVLDGLDVVLQARTTPDQAAAIWRSEGTLRFSSGLYWGARGEELTRAIEAPESDPAVLLGLLPEGAVSVAVQDLFDVWHDAQVAEGAWLCVLPHASQGPRPPVVFRDAAGAQIQSPPEEQSGCSLSFGMSAAELRDDPEAEENERRELLARMTVEPLWPPDTQTVPEVVSWSYTPTEVHDVTLSDGVLSVRASSWRLGDGAAEAREALEHELGSSRDVARALLDAQPFELRLKVSGRMTRFTALVALGRWAAAGQFVVITGFGALPEDLELRRFRLG